MQQRQLFCMAHVPRKWTLEALETDGEDDDHEELAP